MRWDAIVIGTGFGGATAALRLAESGRRVLVLEQGRRFTPSGLDEAGQRTTRLLWSPKVGLMGPLQQTIMRHLFVVSGVGVGGGSLVYAAVHLRPSPTAFDEQGWAATGIDWDAELDEHYDTATSMLGRSVNPVHGTQDAWLREAAASLGVLSTFAATPQGIDFRACTSCGQCISGCPTGAKTTTTQTYLQRAESLGVTVAPLTTVTQIEPVPDGGYRVTGVMTTGGSARMSWTAPIVVVSAGVLGTTRLLLACRDRHRTLPRLSATLGRAVRTNSESFVAITQPPGGPDLIDGATISSDFWPDAITHVTNNRFPDSYSFMRLFLGPLVEGDTTAARRRALAREYPRQLRSILRELGSRDWNRRTTVLTVMQHVDSELELRYRRGAMGWTLSSALPAGVTRPPTYIPQGVAAGKAVASASGGQAYGTVLESALGISTTAHILGGAVISTDADSGVVTPDHEVHGYPGLYVVDGSVVPGNIGVNPSLTITALAERAMARLCR